MGKTSELIMPSVSRGTLRASKTAKAFVTISRGFMHPTASAKSRPTITRCVLLVLFADSSTSTHQPPFVSKSETKKISKSTIFPCTSTCTALVLSANCCCCATSVSTSNLEGITSTFPCAMRSSLNSKSSLRPRSFNCRKICFAFCSATVRHARSFKAPPSTGFSHIPFCRWSLLPSGDFPSSSTHAVRAWSKTALSTFPKWAHL
mmetsp:Transcript_12706/g.37831  ORF Transcript_12706/g.37831 Transcript_12706/m.37831 type:complete len:205 (+) Transcript_12706:347-961(+)